MSNFTNELQKDVKLITKDRVSKPQAIIKFGREQDRWYTWWNGNIIKRYSGQSCGHIVAMRPYIDQFYNKERVQMVIDIYDAEGFRYNNLIDKTYFESELKKIRTTK